jgi:hypothetical protein
LIAIFSLVGSFTGQLLGKAFHLFFGFLAIALGVLTLILAVILLKDVSKFSQQKPMNCKQASDIAHENEYVSSWGSFCNGKYLPSNQTCRK